MWPTGKPVDDGAPEPTLNPHECNNPGSTPILNSGERMQDERNAALQGSSLSLESCPRQLRVRVPPAPEGIAGRDRPTFSILIPAYEAAAVIGRAVQSALAQTQPAKDILVVDDGSSDELASALLPYFNHVRLLTSPHVGLPGARNLGVGHATGDFVAFLDADDELEPEFLAALGTLSAARPDLDILTTDARFVVDGHSDGTFYERNAFPVDDQRMAMLRGCFITTKTAVRRSRLLEVGGFDARLKHGEDWDCWLRLVLSGSRVGLVDAPLSRYHLHEGQMSARRGESLRGRLDIMTEMRTNPRLNDAERSRLAAPLRELRVRTALASGVDGDVAEARSIWLLLARSAELPAVARVAALLAAGAPRLVSRYAPALRRRAGEVATWLRSRRSAETGDGTGEP
jgi:hypothetical protein